MSPFETLLMQLAALALTGLVIVSLYAAEAVWRHVLKPARRYGICRTVYLIGPYAIKTPRFRLPTTRAGVKMTGQRERSWSISRGWQANLSEHQWAGAPGVAPVLRTWFGGLVNVYPRCAPWPEGPEPDYDQIGEGWLPRDRKPENIGILDGAPVWVDYDGSWNGCPHDRNVAQLDMSGDD